MFEMLNFIVKLLIYFIALVRVDLKFTFLFTGNNLKMIKNN